MQAGRYCATGEGLTALGFRAAKQGTECRNATAVGDSALWMNQGQGNTTIGYAAAEYKVNGLECVMAGGAAGCWRLNGDHWILIGIYVGSILSHAASVGVDGATAKLAGPRVVAVGHRAAVECLGSDVVAIGHEAGSLLVSADAAVLNSTFVGNKSGSMAGQKSDAINSMALGANTFTDKDNQVVLGNTAITETIIRGVTRQSTFLVAALPSAVAMGAGARAFVTNASATTFNSIVAGGGSTKVPVFSDGTNWRIG